MEAEEDEFSKNFGSIAIYTDMFLEGLKWANLKSFMNCIYLKQLNKHKKVKNASSTKKIR